MGISAPSDMTGEGEDRLNLRELLTQLVRRGGSDLFLIPGSTPRMRVDGRLVSLGELPVVSATVQDAMEEIGRRLDVPIPATFLDGCPPDRVLELAEVGRFRCHVYRQANDWAMAVRAIPLLVPSFKMLGLPQLLGDLTKKPHGVIIITGPAGSGKTTTLAAMLGKINDERRVHILTLECPVEFRQRSRKSLFSQRSIGSDVAHISEGLSGIHRESPDVVAFGNLDDPDVLESALSLSESGHLVFGIMDGASCLQALQGLLHRIPSHREHMVRLRLAAAVQGMVSQALVPHVKGSGRVLAAEVLLPTTTVRHLVRENKIQQIYSIMQTGQAKHGMQTLNQALVDLYRRRLIAAPAALAHAYAGEELQHLLQRADVRMRSHAAHPAG